MCFISALEARNTRKKKDIENTEGPDEDSVSLELIQHLFYFSWKEGSAGGLRVQNNNKNNNREAESDENWSSGADETEGEREGGDRRARLANPPLGRLRL